MFLIVTGKFLVSEIGVELLPGRLVGEIGFVTPNNKRTQSVECIENGAVMTISYDRLLEIYFEQPDFGYFFLRLTSDRLLQNIARLEAASSITKSSCRRPAPQAHDAVCGHEAAFGGWLSFTGRSQTAGAAYPRIAFAGRRHRERACRQVR